MIESVLARLDEHRAAHLDQLLELLRLPSVSTDPERAGDVRRTATFLADWLGEAGFEAQVVATDGHPCVLADGGPAQQDGPVLLLYGHYDVQPAGDPSLWTSPAFEPTVRNGKLYARGSADDKGQVFAQLCALRAWREVAGQLPVPVRILIEGEEEIGSGHLQGVLEAQRDRLACDYVVISDTAKFDVDIPALTTGTRGLVYKEIVVRGPKHDLHSGGFGGTIANPGNALAAILASLHDSQRRVTIPGFYDQVRPLSPKERTEVASLPFDDEAYRKGVGVPALVGEAGYSTLERQWARPTLDVNGLHGGFTGAGASTIIPASAMAKVSMRIVPDQEPERISAAFDAAVRAAAPRGVTVDIHTHALAEPYLSPQNTVGMSAAVRALERGFGTTPAFARSGGTLPILALFKRILGADSLLMGFCTPDCNAHGPDEFLAVSDFEAGARTAACFLHELISE